MRLPIAIIRVLTAVILLLTWGSTGRAMSAADVERVVATMELLAEDLGDLAYDEDAAADWYEQDAAGEGRIAAAGFDEEAWRATLDATVKAYLATYSTKVMAGIVDEVRSVEKRQDFDDAQSSALRQLIEERIALLERWRREGAADAELVRPFADRIRAVLEGR